jgi:hypothetical protein
MFGIVTSVTMFLEAMTRDEDQDPLTYDWTATSGTIEGSNQTAIWRRELKGDKLVPGVAILVVRDGHGGVAIQRFGPESMQR